MIADFSVVIHATLLAFGLIMPLGLQNIFLFNQGASHKNITGFLPSVITASLCDTLLICLAVLGVSILVLKITFLKYAIFIIGFFFLIYMGYRIWHSASSEFSGNIVPMSSSKQIIFTASVSLLNPHAIIDTIVVIGANAARYNYHDKIIFTVTCILVSWIWFFSLAIMGHKIRKLDKSGFLIKNLNRLSAIIIWLVAGYIAFKLFTE